MQPVHVIGGPDVVVEIRGRSGVVRLDRPAALNAVTTEMLRTCARALDAWVDDPDVDHVVIEGSGDRAFCAGGDLRAMRASALAADEAAPEFFRVEYALNARIARYPKPVVSLMDGIVMGGGVGLGSHAQVRVVTERSRVAMPEVGIGLVPDVGGTWLLSRGPGRLGRHLALTGASVGAADAIAAGLADLCIGSAQLPALREALSAGGDVRATAEAMSEALEGPALLDRAWIDECYGRPSAGEVIEALVGSEHPDAREAAALVATRSPTAVAVTFEALDRAESLSSLEEALEQEFRVSCACLRTHDLVEGIRAQVIDKDRRPAWSPAGLDEVSPTTVASFFEPTPFGRVGLVAG